MFEKGAARLVSVKRKAISFYIKWVLGTTDIYKKRQAAYSKERCEMSFKTKSRKAIPLIKNYEVQQAVTIVAEAQC